MSAYIQKSYVENFLSTAQVDTLLGFGGNTTTNSKNAKMDQLISGSSSVIDSYLSIAYDLPLASNPPIIQQICCYLVLRDLYSSTQEPIPEQFIAQIGTQYSYLEQIRDKKMHIDGISQNKNTGAGGNIIYGVSGSSTLNGSSTTDNPNRTFSVGQLKGTFF
jgi:phage gp36-like protein